MLKCRPAPTPMAANDHLCAADGDPLSDDDATAYRSMVGGLQYLTLTRPDLSFAVNRVCVNIFMLLAPLTGRSSSVFYDMFKAPLPMVSLFRNPCLVLCLL